MTFTVTQSWFSQNNSNWGFPSMLPLTKLLNIKDGFLVNGEVKIVVEVGVLEVVGKSDVLVETPLVNETIDLNGFQVLPSQVRPLLFFKSIVYLFVCRSLYKKLHIWFVCRSVFRSPKTDI